MNISPSRMERLTRLTAASAPKRFVRFSTAMRMTLAASGFYFLFNSSATDSISLRNCELTCS